MSGVRSASHAGTWYSGDASRLRVELDGWLEAAHKTVHAPVAGLIVPHAGYSYSAPTAAWAFKHINPDVTKRLFVLGPSHYAFLSGCGIPRTAAFQTPLGNLSLDTEVLSELHATKKFDSLTNESDETEHSVEMQMPFLYRMMEGHDCTVVPVIVGSLSAASEKLYGDIFAKYLADPANVFVISSDFCHWGRRFSYTPHDSSVGEIWESIKALDHEGMAAIESQDPESFIAYLKRTSNTICGRHPITVFMHAMKVAEPSFDTTFVQYAQSSKVHRGSDSSVSYAAGVISRKA